MLNVQLKSFRIESDATIYFLSANWACLSFICFAVSASILLVLLKLIVSIVWEEAVCELDYGFLLA